jgi:hypothetical protein
MEHIQGTNNETNYSFLCTNIWVGLGVQASVKLPSHYLPSALQTGVNIYK